MSTNDRAYDRGYYDYKIHGIGDNPYDEDDEPFDWYQYECGMNDAMLEELGGTLV
jgi:hypothetical protein